MGVAFGLVFLSPPPFFFFFFFFFGASSTGVVCWVRDFGQCKQEADDLMGWLMLDEQKEGGFTGERAMGLRR